MAEPVEINQLIKNHATDKYFIEYGPDYTNHVSIGIIVLWKLGAETEFIQKLVDQYVLKLADPDNFPDDAVDSLVIENMSLADIMGQRKGFYKLLQHYQQILHEEYADSIDKLISAVFSNLVTGMGGAALHGMIYIGYGHAVKSARVVCEGLAYMHHSFMPLAPKGHYSFGKGTKDVLKIVEEIENDLNISAFMNSEREKPHWAEKYGEFERSYGVLVTYRSDVLLTYVESVKIPDHIDLSKLNTDKTTVVNLGKWLVDCAILVYTLCTRKNDFFLIHGVTSAWSLLQILPILRPEEVMNAVKTQLCALFATFLVQGCPHIDVSSLEEIMLADESWEDIKREAISEIRDEHIYKLVQVCYEQSMDSGRDQQLEKVYRHAASIAITCPLVEN